MTASVPPQPEFGKAIGLILLATLVLSCMDATGKWLTQQMPVPQVVWARFFFHTVAMFVVLSQLRRFAFLRSRRPVRQTVRALMLLVTTLMMYVGLRHVPLGNAVTLLFLAPVLVTFLSALYLGEALTRHRVGAVIAAFTGVVIIIQPGGEGFILYSLFPFAAAFSLSVYLTMTRSLHLLDNESTTLFYTTALPAALLTLALPVIYQPIALHLWPLLVLMGLLGAAGHTLLIKAYALAAASSLSPFLYAQVAFSAALGMMFFDDRPGLSFLLGALMLTGSGVYLWWKESRRRGPRVATPARTD